MASYHLSVKTISRSAGRSATAAAAYRSADKIKDQRTGEIFDYSKRKGVESTELILPAGAPDWAADRAALWNAAEQSENRKNSTVAREFEIALPSELSPAERKRLAHDFARELSQRHGCAVDVAIHSPGKGGDNRNFHAHLLLSTRRLTPEGFGEKTRELDDRKSGEVERWRERWAELQNARLQEAGLDARVDHRTLEAQGIDREPTIHLGPAATAMERRGERTRAGDYNREVVEAATARIYAAREIGKIEREIAATERELIDLSGDLAKAKAERDQREKIEAKLSRFDLDFERRFAERQKPAQAVQEEQVRRPQPQPTGQAQAAQAEQERKAQEERQHREQERQVREERRLEANEEARRALGESLIARFERAIQPGPEPEKEKEQEKENKLEEKLAAFERDFELKLKVEQGVDRLEDQWARWEEKIREQEQERQQAQEYERDDGPSLGR